MTKEYILLPLPTGVESMSRVFLKGKYEGVVYQYGKVTFNEEGDTLRIAFEYQVFSNPDNVNTEDAAFRDHIGKILGELIEKVTGDI